MLRRIVLPFLLVALFIPSVHGQTIDQLRNQIEDKNRALAEIEAQIKQYQTQLGTTQQQSQTLKQEVTRLTSQAQKLSADIKLTQGKISKAELTIEKLGLEIGARGEDIDENKQSLGETMRQLRTMEENSLIEILLSQNRLTDFWSEEEHLGQLRSQIDQTIGELEAAKRDLEGKREQTAAEKAKLAKLTNELADRKRIADSNKANQQTLLTQTQNKETTYKELISNLEARRAAFARELAEIESQLRLQIDPSSIPRAGNKILLAPLDEVYITQQFGQTADAKRLYASGTHNGIDFRASIGTPVKASDAGVVSGVGDTDVVCRGASYGKWVLITHDNGLVTLSAHLSLIKVAGGERVIAGQLIGYSGATGYATGPHLHFTVAAAQGVQVSSLKSKVCPGTYVMPIFDTRAYLDPLDYVII